MMGVGNCLQKPCLTDDQTLDGARLSRMFYQKAIWLLPSEDLCCREYEQLKITDLLEKQAVDIFQDDLNLDSLEDELDLPSSGLLINEALSNGPTLQPLQRNMDVILIDETSESAAGPSSSASLPSFQVAQTSATSITSSLQSVDRSMFRIEGPSSISSAMQVAAPVAGITADQSSSAQDAHNGSRVEELESLVNDLLNQQDQQNSCENAAESVHEILNTLKSTLVGPCKRITIEEEYALEDALGIYKDTQFSPTVPLKIKLSKQPAIDTGGVLKHFYTIVFDQMFRGSGSFPPLFEGEMGRKLPIYNTAVAVSGLLTLTGKIFAHSIAQCGIGPFCFSEAVYHYIASGDFNAAVSKLEIDDATARTRYFVDEILKITDDQYDTLASNEEFIDLTADAGITAQLTPSSKDAFVQNLIVHDVFGKRKVLLDQIRSGLEILDVLKFMKSNLPMMKVFFLKLDIKPDSVIELLSCNQHDHQTLAYLKQFLNISENGMLQDFLFFSTASKCIPFDNIEVTIKRTDAIYAQACFNSMTLPDNFADFEQFRVAIESAILTVKRNSFSGV